LRWDAEGSGTLIELYTSEGCSSCPAADQWLSTLKSRPEIWKKLVPVSFHVSYWDQLGWPDRFAKKEFTDRQRAHAKRWGTDTIYTPGVVFQGKESRTNSLPFEVKVTLKASWDGSFLTVKSSGFEGGQLYVAWLAMNQATDIKRGENAGKKLAHDFIVLELRDMGDFKNDKKISFLAPTYLAVEAQALAIWIEKDGVPIVAVGGEVK
jgi:hypothetical protein